MPNVITVAPLLFEIWPFVVFARGDSCDLDLWPSQKMLTPFDAYKVGMMIYQISKESAK